ncbi:ribosome small subunit-dependent GTPase A [Clostridiales bacterium F-3ap]|uniref:Small ribosomal subunit biogenesis GTPase RsgA n=2 Tax=Anaerotalea alkaliphila TaxID=2662126 RepID=A0A7X5HUJ2_9FIRM|nr:ribosome small subunit-dependent GTPase A [Anaerotalea alkaliphila]NDL66885.1 ribosome small subunit-dependent GTPase A [Anaerotalea alkaliphila]
MRGKIVKGIAGFYYVHVPEHGVFECKARGIFRKEALTPMIGDDVEIQVVDPARKKGNIEKILERRSELLRPSVANIDQALLVFALHQPEPNLQLLDRFLAMVENAGIDVVLCFNKADTEQGSEGEALEEMYRRVGYHVLVTSALEDRGLEPLKKVLHHKTTVFAGPSGVGKSSLLNLLQEAVSFETGSVSRKIGRGRHTTRHVELIALDKDSYLVDTPGFSSLQLDDFSSQDLKDQFIDFHPFLDACRFKGCMHLKEPVCGVKEAVRDGKIHPSRYENYKAIYEEMQELQKNQYPRKTDKNRR